jgi:hypothetical protein
VSRTRRIIIEVPADADWVDDERLIADVVNELGASIYLAHVVPKLETAEWGGRLTGPMSALVSAGALLAGDGHEEAADSLHAVKNTLVTSQARAASALAIIDDRLPLGISAFREIDKRLAAVRAILREDL